MTTIYRPILAVIGMAACLAVLDLASIRLGARSSSAAENGPGSKILSAAGQKAVANFYEAIDQLNDEYTARYETDIDEYSNKVEAVKKQGITELQAARRSAMETDELDEALRIRSAENEIREFDSQLPMVDTTSIESEIVHLKNEIRRLRRRLSVRAAEKRISARILRGSVEFQRHHYFVFETPSTWHVAREICGRSGGHLARIESPEENAFLKQLIVNRGLFNYWIDGTDEHQEGDWRFSNNLKMKYADWLSKEPSNSGGREHAVYLWSRVGWKWNDAPSSERNHFICEWDE